MKRKLVSLLLSALLAVMLALPVTPAYAAGEDFYQQLGQLLKQQDDSSYFNAMELNIGSHALTVDGETQQMDVAPALKNNRTMLPIRAIAEAAGAEVGFDDASRTVTIVGASGDMIRCKTGASSMTVNGEVHSLDTPSYIQGGRTYLPVRAVSEALELDVQWEAATRGVTITAPYQTGRVLAWTGSQLDTSALQADTALYDGNGLWVLQFSKPAEAKAAAETLTAQGIPAEPDAYLPPMNDKTSSASSLSWGVSDCQLDRFVENSSFAESGVVAVVDTGVDASHPHLKGKVLPGRDFVDGDSDPRDEHHHGTHVAGTVLDCVGTAPVKILPVRVLNREGFGYDVTIVSGIRYAADQNADVINLSLRWDRFGSGTDNIDRAVQYAVGKGSLVVAAAGNDGQDTVNYCPAHLTSPGVVVVSAGDRQHRKADFSNYGSSVDLMAPGVGIRSSVPGGGYRAMDGTSMAAPHVSAAAVLLDLASDRSLTPAQLEAKVRAATTHQGKWQDGSMGCGFLTLKDVLTAPTVPPEEPEEPKPEEPKPEGPIEPEKPEVKVTAYRYSVASLNLKEGESASVRVSAVYSDGSTKDVTREAALYSSNTGVASVDASGNVKALKKGTTVLAMGSTPAAGVSLPLPVSVTVRELPPEEIVVDKVVLSSSFVQLTPGESGQIHAVVYSNSTPSAAVTWQSSDPSVATVTDGKITAVKPGDCTITASAKGKRASCRVRVNEYQRSDFQIKVLSGPAELTQGETGSFTLEIKTPVPYEAGSHPLVLYCALYVNHVWDSDPAETVNGWLEYQSKYYDGGSQTVVYKLDTSLHDIPPGKYRMAFSLFYADRFYSGASLVDTFQTLTLK